MSNTMVSGIIVGLLAMILWTPYLMARGIFSLGVEGKVPIPTKIKAAVPILNLVIAEKEYYGKFGLILGSYITLILGVIQRYIAWRYMYENVKVGTASILLFWGLVLLFLFANMKFVYNVIKDAGAMSGFKLIIFTIAYPFGQYYVGVYLSNVIRHNKAKKETFKL